MKASKRVQKILAYIDELEKHFAFFTGDKMGEYEHYFQEIRELMEELAIERKADHARFARKLKGLWKSQEE